MDKQLTTGIPELDEMIGGFAGGEVILLAGRPYSGKATLARRIAEHLTREEHKRVRLFSLEGRDRGMDFSDIRSEVSADRFDLVIVDFLQLLTRPGSPGRWKRDIATAKALRSLAKEQDIPVLVLSSLSRHADGRKGHIPKLRDILASPTILSYVDTVLFLVREGWYEEAKQDTRLTNIYCTARQGRKRHARTNSTQSAFGSGNGDP